MTGTAPIAATAPVPPDMPGTAPAAPAGPVDPSLAELSADERAALQRVLGDGAGEAVELVAQHRSGRDRLVLLRRFDARVWKARQAAAGRMPAKYDELDERVENCAPGDADLVDIACALPLTGDLHLAWLLLGTEVFAWEVARVGPGAGGLQVLARVRLVEATPRVDAVDAPDPPKFKVYDIDGDRRPEVTVIVPLRPPQEANLEQTVGELGFVLDAADLHAQFSATRRYAYVFQDVGGSFVDAETVWLARDVDADGHADLQVRETVRTTHDDGEGARAERRTATRKTVCPYDPASDAWRCPEALGRQLLDPGAAP